MRAAVVRSFDRPPRYETFRTPEPNGEHEIAVDVLAAGLHPRVRSGASGSDLDVVIDYLWGAVADRKSVV